MRENILGFIRAMQLIRRQKAAVGPADSGWTAIFVFEDQIPLLAATKRSETSGGIAKNP
jgi:hypothetical protein